MDFGPEVGFLALFTREIWTLFYVRVVSGCRGVDESLFVFSVHGAFAR